MLLDWAHQYIQRSEVVADAVDVDGPESTTDLRLISTAGILALGLLHLQILTGGCVATETLGPALEFYSFEFLYN